MKTRVKKILSLAVLISLLAAGCAKVQLQHEVPSSPAASYNQLPR